MQNRKEEITERKCKCFNKLSCWTKKWAGAEMSLCMYEHGERKGPTGPLQAFFSLNL